MKTQISFHNLEKASHEGLENTIHELARRHIERYLSRFPADTAELQVRLEKSRHRNYYQVGVQLIVPNGTLTGRQEGYDLKAALRKAFDEIERELLRHISRMRGDDAWRRRERREELRRLKTAVSTKPDTGADAFGDQVRALLPQLQHFVQREISALRARGDLNPGYPTPQDVIDELLARAYERLDKRPPDLELLHWLYQLTHEVLTDEVRKSWREVARFSSLEAKAPVPRDYTVDEQDQGVREFWQPDEMLKMIDVVPVSEATPEEIVGDEELRRYLHDALAKMPNKWRRALWLTQAEGIPATKVARMMGASEEEVKRWVHQADEYLRAQLAEAGYKPAEEGTLPAYFVPMPANATPELAQALDEVTKGAK